MKHLLFVDDEKEVLDGLRALLRHKRASWDMTFVTSGEEALRELETGNFDVIVSDMRMPTMDGSKLLKQVLERHPRVVRIALSGYAELDTALGAIPVAHQFIVKPSGADEIEEVVERACSLRDTIMDEAIRTAVGRVKTLPTLPSAYLTLTKVLADEKSGLHEVVSVIESDPALCAKTLQLVNSAFIGLGRSVSDIGLAVSYLGTHMLKNLVLATKVYDSDNAGKRWTGLDALRDHSLLVGSVARRIAGDRGHDSDDAFVAGVLHDVGKLVLSLDESTWPVLDAGSRGDVNGCAAERSLFGATHAEIGAYLLGIWGLPHAVVEAVAFHHAPSSVPHREPNALTAVYLANYLVVEENAHEPLDEAYVERLGLLDRLPEWHDLAQGVMEGRKDRAA